MTDDNELQRSIENKEPVGNSADAKAYRTVFDVLAKEPYHLPATFADSVLSKIESRSKFATDHIWMGLGLFSLLVGGLVTCLFLNFRINFGSFKFISGYAGLIVFGIFFILAVQLIDKRLIQKNLR
jgi:hypothetical protein